MILLYNLPVECVVCLSTQDTISKSISHIIMVNTIKKLGNLSDSITETTGLELDVYATAHVADMLCGVDNALSVFDVSCFYYGNNATLLTFDKNTDIKSFEVVNSIFEWVANEIVELNAHLSGRLVNENEVRLFKEKMLYDYNGADIVSTVNKYALKGMQVVVMSKVYQNDAYIILRSIF